MLYYVDPPIFGLFLAKTNQATLLRSGEMGFLTRNRSPISPDLSNIAWLGLAKKSPFNLFATVSKKDSICISLHLVALLGATSQTIPLHPCSATSSGIRCKFPTEQGLEDIELGKAVRTSVSAWVESASMTAKPVLPSISSWLASPLGVCFENKTENLGQN